MFTWKRCSLVLLALLVLFSTQVLAGQILTVGLYPDVPRVEQFKAVIEAEWKKVEPNVSIVWDDSWGGGYEADPSSSLDVYVFDTLFLSYFNAQGFLHNLPKSQVENFDDFLDYAKAGVVNGDYVLGVPQLGCTTVLYYRTDDKPVAEAKTLADLMKALGTCTYYPEIPPARTGLMVDFSNESANAGYYIQSLNVTRTDGLFNCPIARPRWIRRLLASSSRSSVCPVSRMPCTRSRTVTSAANGLERITDALTLVTLNP